MSILNAEELLSQYNQSLSHVLPKAVGTNLVLWSSVSVRPSVLSFPTVLPVPQCSSRYSQLGTVLLFNILRPRNKVFLCVSLPRCRPRQTLAWCW